jgi:hypothetical protein
MSQAYHEAKYLIEERGLIRALELAEQDWLEEAHHGEDRTYEHYCYAIYCYIRGWRDALDGAI